MTTQETLQMVGKGLEKARKTNAYKQALKCPNRILLMENKIKQELNTLNSQDTEQLEKIQGLVCALMSACEGNK